ncbi:MAG: LysR family transcriptional regulator [Marinilabiliaceae bacterium]|nr:LysR family transcriptional regulator [Marinilabiliaceae bacterium]
MNFQQLEYVLAVHNNKHFGQASECCNITQATLSAMIKKLEEELGFLIFDRSRMPVKTTDMGQNFIVLTKKALQNRQEMYQLKNETIKELTGNLSLGIIPTIANSLLPIILPSILKENPKLHLSITEITTDNIIHQLKTDKIDLGILATPLNDETLDETILYYEAMMVYGVSDSQKRYISSNDIRDKKIWLLEEGNCFRKQSMTICEMKEKTMDTDNLNFEGSSFETLLNLTDSFGGITLIPELYFNQLSNNRKNKTKSFDIPIPVREISLVSHRPYSKIQTINLISNKIKHLIKNHLSTSTYKPKDLEIIGI